MQLLPEDPVWSVADAEAVNFFLTSPTGRRFLDKLLYRKPDYSAFSSAEKRLVESGVGEGYEKALQEMQKLSQTRSATQ